MISFTTMLRKFMVERILPIRDKVFGDMQGKVGFRERRLSAKLHDSVLVIRKGFLYISCHGGFDGSV